MEMTKRGAVQFLSPPLPPGDQLAVQGFTTRHGGLSRPPYNSLNLGFNTQDQHSNVEGNRSLLARAVGSRLERMVTVNQVHGTDLLVIDAPNPEFGHFQRLECDGIVTNQPQVLIGVCVADCYPILLLDPEKRVAAALHAGWKGTAAGICRKGVAAMVEIFGCRPRAIHAAIGPGIEPCCYEVDEPVRSAFMAQGNGWEPFAQPSATPGRWGLDLATANRLQLMQAGIPGGQVSMAGQCVSCSGNLYFSYRRDHGETGRQMGFIMLR